MPEGQQPSAGELQARAAEQIIQEAQQEKPEQPLAPPVRKILGEINASDTLDSRKTLEAIAGASTEQPAIDAHPNGQEKKRNRIGFISNIGEAITSEGKLVGQNQESMQQNKEQNVDERLAAERKGFDENVAQLTQNLAELGNSNGEPGQGSQATQEKWQKLKNGLRILALRAAKSIIRDVIIRPLIREIDVSTGRPVLSSTLDARVLSSVVESKAFQKGWAKIKSLEGGESRSHATK